MADPDQERLVLSGVCVEVNGGRPKLRPKNGKWRAFDAKGKLKAEGGFSNGQLKGRWTFWHANGQKKTEGEYVKDLREGKWTEWNEGGEVVAEQVFRQGSPLKP
jgi:antitoxin component YwqK of YwqJK toxin-antitoxin module